MSEQDICSSDSLAEGCTDCHKDPHVPPATVPTDQLQTASLDRTWARLPCSGLKHLCPDHRPLGSTPHRKAGPGPSPPLCPGASSKMPTWESKIALSSGSYLEGAGTESLRVANLCSCPVKRATCSPPPLTGGGGERGTRDPHQALATQGLMAPGRSQCKMSTQ